MNLPHESGQEHPSGHEFDEGPVRPRRKGVYVLPNLFTLAALFGAVPLALATGPGAELRSPLGITIIGGMLLSQVLTLYTTPVVYLALERLATARRAPLRKLTTHLPPVPDALT